MYKSVQLHLLPWLDQTEIWHGAGLLQFHPNWASEVMLTCVGSGRVVHRSPANNVYSLFKYPIPSECAGTHVSVVIACGIQCTSRSGEFHMKTLIHHIPFKTFSCWLHLVV